LHGTAYCIVLNKLYVFGHGSIIANYNFAVGFSRFGFLDAAVEESTVELEEKIKETKFLLHRLNSEQKSQQEVKQTLNLGKEETKPNKERIGNF